MTPTLLCVLALWSPFFTEDGVERKKLIDWLRKSNPDAEVFIHPAPQEGKLKEAGWERVPFTWRGEKIWIRRGPPKAMQVSA
jgi:hypothetical protein